MYFIIFFVFVLLLAYLKTDFIRKNSVKLYAVAFLIAIADIGSQIYLISQKIRLQGLIQQAESIFSRGILGTAFIAVVMYTGALNSRKPLTKKLLSVRAELSIIGCLFIIPHNVVYGYYSLNNLLKVWSAPASNFKTTSLCISLSGILAVAIMIPLFVTSFRTVRKKMKAKSWKKLQSLSYLFYFLIYFQIMMISLGFENRKNYLSAALYSVVFISYAILRIRKKLSSAKS
ncbi:MAG: ferric reductase-like transmembrane domain-containing protein [Peptostreptococcaceae bacterium]|nr:ferric reductase-like transmembrane domain-containing protein [Peptostreptococcaceae bacterium]